MIPIETRVANLENLVDALSKKIDRNQFYNNADMNGNRQSISNITPYTETKTAYIGDTECVFEGVPSGCVAVYINGTPDGCVIRYEPTDRVVIHFDEPLEEVTEVTISIQ